MEIRRWASVLSEDDIAAFEKGGFGRRMGFGSKPALLVIDMTKLFVDPKYPNAYGDRAEQALEAYRELLGVSRELRLPIFFSRRDSRRTEVERGVTALKWGHTEDPLWLVDPEADEWPESIEPRDGEYVIRKSKPSAFFETPLRSQLAYLGVDTLIVGGVSTSGCVRAAVTDAFSCNLRVIVPEECCADRSSLSHAVSLIDMDMKFADVMPLAEVVAELRKTVLTTSLSK